VTSPAAFDLVRALVLRRAAIVLEGDKDYLLRARLEPLALEEGLSGFDELIARLESGASDQLESRVVDAMATHETRFFREPATFQALADHVLPTLFEARRARLCSPRPLHDRFRTILRPPRRAAASRTSAS